MVLSAGLALIFLGIGCQHREKEDPEPYGFIQYETHEGTVQIPGVNWHHTLAIQPLLDRSRSSAPYPLSKLITEHLVAGLAQLEEVQVIPPAGPDTAAAFMPDTDYILRGMVQEEQGRVMVTLRLVDTAGDTNLWSGSYIENTASLFTLADKAADGIRHALDPSMTWDTTATAQSSPGEYAVTAYLTGKDYLEKRTYQDADRAIRFFKQALNQDSTFVPAWTGLADAYLMIFSNGWSRRIIWINLAIQACSKALTLDPDLADAYVRLGTGRVLLGDWHDAETAFRQALLYGASQPEAWTGLAGVWAHFGLYAPALKAYGRAYALNPSDSSIAVSMAMLQMGEGRFAEAEKTLAQALQIRPDASYLKGFLALACYFQNHIAEAGEYIESALTTQIHNPLFHAVKAMILISKKQPDNALAELELEVKPYAGNDPALATAIAAVYCRIGRNGLAIEWLRKAVGWGYLEYPWLMNDPNFRNLHDDPRFQTLTADLKMRYESRVRTYENLRSPLT